jgi:hypothetical protein
MTDNTKWWQCRWHVQSSCQHVMNIATFGARSCAQYWHNLWHFIWQTDVKRVHIYIKAETSCYPRLLLLFKENHILLSKRAKCTTNSQCRWKLRFPSSILQCFSFIISWLWDQKEIQAPRMRQVSHFHAGHTGFEPRWHRLYWVPILIDIYILV